MQSRAVVSGLAPLLRDLRAAGELEARKELMGVLKAGGGVIRDEARRNALAHGLVGQTGRLLKELKVSATARRVVIKDTARNPKDGYPYPSRFEFAKRSGHGRAFLNPALDSKLDEALATITSGLDHVLDKHHL